ncbi:hypothetical protein LPJ61_006428, partial [Coemansia biformis]
PMIVYLTARNVDRGQQAFDELKREQLRRESEESVIHGNELRFHQLDVGDVTSIQVFIDYLTLMHGDQSIDVLINNAGGVVRRPNGGSSSSRSQHSSPEADSIVRTCDADTAYRLIHMNYYTAVSMTTMALPHMRAHGRVVFLVTALAHLGIFSGDLPRVLTSDDLTLAGLNIIENGFISSVGKGTYANYGFPPMPFAVAKAGLIAFARLLARSMSNDKRQLMFAAVCPGYVHTDMTGPYAPLTPDEGAETPVYVALTDSKRLVRHNGGLWKRLKPMKW